MARTISDEELQLKRRARRRLIGAIVLVAATVVVLPMVLDSEPKPVGRDVSIQIPSPGSGNFASRVNPSPAPGAPPARAMAAAPGEAAKVVDPKPAPAAPQATASVQPAPAQSKAAETAAKAGTPPAKTPEKIAKPVERKAPGRYVVQVIALADAQKAKQMQGRIEAAGIPSYTEVVKTVKGDVTRVRAGPFATRGAADKAREQLKALGMSGNIIAR